MTIAIVGGGLAGAKAAEAARAFGYDGRIVVIGDEPHRPYERPPLSKAVLRGEAEPSSALVFGDDFYGEHDIEVVTGRAVEMLDVRGGHIRLDGGDVVPFDAAVLATGAAPRRLDIPGADLAGVHYLRTVDDAVVLREAIGSAGRVAIVGAGWIGCEVAASARQMGADVVLLDPAPVPLHRVLGAEVGAIFGRLHADNGVVLRMGVAVTELRGHGHVEAVALADGRTEAADVVVVGIGVTPRTDVAKSAGLDVANGVLVNERLQTSARTVYAAGDIANAWHPRYRRPLRVEHWANALNQGATAGRNAAGAREVYDRLPYFFSDQFDLGMEYVGHADGTDAVAILGDVDQRRFIALWEREGRVTAAMNVNIWDVGDDLRAIVSGEREADVDRLVRQS
jgi:3-phenylpropionate/trans-cinnamate dioxygenase ferredoxin reductase subunit